LGSWAEIAGSAQSVGVIVSASDSAVVSAAEAAGASLGINVIAEFAESDREAIYRFKRLARDVDGLWLFPDSAILGPAVMREMFAYASEHGVHTIVFSPALLDWGALISVGSSADEIAAAVAGAVEKIRHGQTADLPRVTALKVVDIAINEEVAIAVDFGGTGRQVDDLSTAQTRAR
jgi:ABC-type uncharacterized transport system substrate-binding protein